jgi:PAS domain S-box-containing protein
MKKFRLSTYIALTISFLVFTSTAIISGVLYFSLEESLTSEFEERVKAEGGEVGQALQNRFDTIKSRLKAVTLDNAIRVTLMLGAQNQLQEHLNRNYGNNQWPHFFIFKKNSKKYFTPSDLHLNPEEILNRRSVNSNEISIVKDDQYGFMLTYSLPIFRQQEQLGTALSIYLFSEDKLFSQFFSNRKNSSAILVDENVSWDLFSGQPITLSNQPKVTAKINPQIIYFNKNAKKVAAVPKNKLPGLFFVTSLDSLNAAKRKVALLVLIPGFGVILLTVVGSLILGKKFGIPLSQVSNLALSIAEGKSDVPVSKNTSNIIEIEQLLSSLHTMFANLQQAQELQRYQELFEGVADIVFIHDISGRIIEVNQIAIIQFGFSRTDFLDIKLTDIVPEKLHGKLQKILTDLSQNGKESFFETEFVVNKGNHIFVECNARKICYQNKEVILNVIRNITDRKQAEDSLMESHRTLRTILDSIKATICVSDLETYRIIFVNQYAKKIFGPNIEGKCCYEVFRNEASPCRHCTNKQLIGPDGQPLDVLIWEGRNPVTKRWYLNHERAIRWLDGRLVRFQISLDINEMKILEKERIQTEARLRKIQKMEMLGTLAGGVAHDLNNILTGIVSYPDLLLMQLPEKSPLKEPILIIKQTGEKAAAIVQDLLTLSRRGVVADEVVNLNEIIHDYLNSPEHKNLISFHKNIHIITNLDSNLLNILGSPVHLSKTIMNLVLNAVEDMSEGGMIMLTTEMQYVDKPIGAYEDVVEGEYVKFSVTDTGHGIPSNYIDRIFEPFFTKKIMGKSGTGLGMAVVWGTVKDHEGYIDVNTAEGKGTAFSLYFPITRKEMIKESLTFNIQDYRGNGESILVIDDAKEQREIVNMMFTHLGYKVSAVSSGEEAIEYIKHNPVDLLILDMIMEPGIDGLETYKRIIELHPGQKAVIASGYSETDRVKKAQKLGARQYIKKPYIFKKIAAAVKAELATNDKEPIKIRTLA